MALVTAAEKQIAECHCEMQLQLKSLSSLLKKRLPFSVCAKVCSNFCLSFFYCITSIFCICGIYQFSKNKKKKTNLVRKSCCKQVQAINAIMYGTGLFSHCLGIHMN